MSDKEVEEIQASDMAAVEPSTSKDEKARQKKSNRFVEEWMKLFPGSPNANVADDQAFIDPYALYRDVVCPGVIGSKIFKYFYHNREKKIHVCNPW